MELIGPYLAACMLLVVAGGAKAARPGDTARAVAVTMRRRPGQVQPIVRSAAAGEAILGIAAMARPSPITASLVAASYLGFAVFVGVALARAGHWPAAAASAHRTRRPPVPTSSSTWCWPHRR